MITELPNDENTMLDQMFIKVCDSLKDYDEMLNDQFKHLGTNFDRFRLIWTPSVVHTDIDRLLETKNFDAKDSVKSLQCRQQGNDEFKRFNFNEALILYTQSIRFAVNPKLKSGNDKAAAANSDDLAMCYANRSAAFYQLNEFELCLNDIEASFKYGYPEKSRDKLIERKLHCFYKLERYRNILEYIKENRAMNLEIFQVYETKLEDLKSQSEELKALIEQVKEVQPKKSMELELNGKLGNLKFAIPEEEKSSKLQNSSKKIEMDYSVTEGFHFKAAEDIKVGELLIDEPPYASVLLADNIKTCCFECMKPINLFKMNVTYCRQCTFVAYCSEACEKASWHGHRYECKYLKLLAFESGITHMEWLAFRIVAKASYKYLSSIKDDLISYEDKYERGDIVRAESSILPPGERSKKYRSDAYFNVFHLVTNSFLRRTGDLFRRSYVALFLTKILVKTGFISGVKTPQELKQSACFVGGLVLRHLQSVSCNAHEISQIKLDSDAKKPLESAIGKGIGAGIYALLSIFNHSCDPHVTRNFIGSRCQVRAIRNANKTEEVFDNYGVVYAVNPADERSEKLVNQYFFSCRCKPCSMSWPLFEKIPNNLKQVGIRCDDCKPLKEAKKECPNCDNEFDSVKVFQFLCEQSIGNLLMYRESIELDNEVTQKRVALIYDAFCEYLQILDEANIKKPFRDVNDYQEALKQCANLVHLKINS